MLSHEAHLLRVLASPELSLEDLGRAACVCRAWRAAVGRDDALFEAALRRDSPALAAARNALLSCRMIAASTRSALKTPRSRAPAWAYPAAEQHDDWTLVVDLYDVGGLPGQPARNIFSAAVPLATLRYQNEDAPDFMQSVELYACARHADALAPPPPTPGALMTEFGCSGLQRLTEALPGAGEGFRHRVRMMALHRSGNAVVFCTLKKPYDHTRYTEGGLRALFATGTRSSSSMSFQALFGTGPRLIAHLELYPAPSSSGRRPEACSLDFSRTTMLNSRMEEPDTDSGMDSEDVEDQEDYGDLTQDGVLRTMLLGPLRWTWPL